MATLLVKVPNNTGFATAPLGGESLIEETLADLLFLQEAGIDAYDLALTKLLTADAE